MVAQHPGDGRTEDDAAIDDLRSVSNSGIGRRPTWEATSRRPRSHASPERVFAYIDELSAASVAGHADELAKSGRVREQDRERLGSAILSGEPPEVLRLRAERVDWAPPATLTAVVLPSTLVRGAIAALDHRTLIVAAGVAAPTGEDEAAVLLVPDTPPPSDDPVPHDAGQGPLRRAAQRPTIRPRADRRAGPRRPLTRPPEGARSAASDIVR